ncbi:GntR family transcriptional regulator [Arthrobacter sp. RIT-PI-e]|uniref:GntR family transcriptional regulator n=1 Tax=Arthrobacter sp. RIT-PI-e TaxID=1681197 RepID=UPI00067676C4|nr:GntR family transcriptional regulator [Arthrobacter sp. RIT-PI-e]KNC17214.1 GntR family transcriptional regulator [Arthrobacter sp. RIT-PI-e]
MSLTTGIFTKNDYAYAEVRSRILTGELEPGSVISQARLAQELGVSTTPLREAIRRLAAEGMILLEAHRDARVSAVSAHEAKHLHEVRESVDPLAAGLAAERRTEEQLELMGQALRQLTPLRSTTTLDALMAHREFHRAVYRASGNAILVDILEHLWDKSDRYRLIGLRARADSPDDSTRIEGEHEEILAAVTAGDSARAHDAMRLHVRHSFGRHAITALEDGSTPDRATRGA